MSANPTTALRAPAPGRDEIRFLDAEQVAALANAIHDRYRALIWTLAYAGLRPGEAVALRVRDLDLLKGEINVSRAVSEVGGRLIEGSTRRRRSGKFRSRRPYGRN
jgi:integrase